MECEYCEVLRGKSKSAVIYEDDFVMAVVKDLVTTPGQITIFPKKHFTIMELVPDNLLKKCADLANKLGIAVFESLGCHGTNILIQNGITAGQRIPHFSIEVIPRREEDELKLDWKTHELSEDEIDTTYLMLKEEGDKLVNIGKKEPQKELNNHKNVPKKISKEKSEKNKENYLLKSLKRIP